MKILKALLFPILYMVIYYFFQFFFGFLGMVLLGISEFTAKQGISGVEAIGNVLVTAIIISGIISFFIYWGITYLRKQKFFKVCNFKKVKFHYLIIALILGLTLNTINEYLLFQLLKIDVFKEAFAKYMYLSEFITNTNIVIAILGVGIIGPIIEEVIFRGLIFNELRNIMPIPVVIVVQGMLFGIYHFNLLQFIYAALTGVLLGIIYVLTKSLWVPIFIHIVNNITALIIPEREDTGNSVIFIAAIIITSVCCVYFYKKRERYEKNVNENSA